MGKLDIWLHDPHLLYELTAGMCLCPRGASTAGLFAALDEAPFVAVRDSRQEYASLLGFAATADRGASTLTEWRAESTMVAVSGKGA